MAVRVADLQASFQGLLDAKQDRIEAHRKTSARTWLLIVADKNLFSSDISSHVVTRPFLFEFGDGHLRTVISSRFQPPHSSALSIRMREKTSFAACSMCGDYTTEFPKRASIVARISLTFQDSG
jgi:hypothetical protein